VSKTVCVRELGDGHSVEVTWTRAQTAVPTGELESASRRTRYFVEVLIDGLYYFANRFVTSPDAEGVTDPSGTPILARTDVILEVCADRVADAIGQGHLDSLPNDLGTVDIDELLRRAATHSGEQEGLGVTRVAAVALRVSDEGEQRRPLGVREVERFPPDERLDTSFECVER
jgi:hypothetical protein